MVERCHQWTNWKILSEIIPFQTRPYAESPKFLQEKYINEGWSTRKIAKHSQCSKAFVLSKLDKYGIQKRRRGYTTPIPFGKRMDKNGKIIPFVKEQKIIKRIINMKNQRLSFRKIAYELNKANIPSKKGGNWHHFFIRNIYLKHN